MDNSGGQLRWGPEQRLEFIEFRLFWDGWINRSDLVERFGVSIPQASNDLTQYREIAPGNLHYDSSAKRYLANDDFKPVRLRPNPDRYLAQLKAMSDGVIVIADTWITDPPSVDAMPIPVRMIESAILRLLIKAVRSNKSIAVKYHSMSDDRLAPLWRRISPHAFVYDGLRWHTRAYCHESNRYKDFLLSRCSGTGALEDGVDARNDTAWNTVFEIVLIPNPALSMNQQAAVAWDYNMVDGKVTVPVRVAHLYYFDKRLRLDIPSDRPKERPIVVANEEDFRRTLQSVAT